MSTIEQSLNSRVAYSHLRPESHQVKGFRRLIRQTRVCIAMPAYNERDTLPALIPRVVQTMEETPYAYEIVVVDDGSSDETTDCVRHLAETFPVRLVEHKINRGLGAAMMTALYEGSKELVEEDILIILDADNTHPPSLIPRMVQMIRDGRDIVIASRFREMAGVVGLSRFREIHSYGASWMMRFLFGIKGCRDYTCGYRAYRVGMVRKALDKHGEKLVLETGFAAMAEILLNMAKLGAVVGEIPLLLRYDFKRGASKMRIGRTVYRTIRMVIRHRFS